MYYLWTSNMTPAGEWSEWHLEATYKARGARTALINKLRRWRKDRVRFKTLDVAYEPPSHELGTEVTP
jgi:hypothetical protein